MPTVVQPNNLVVDTDQKVIDYLVGVAVRPRIPFERGTSVNITNRSQIPGGTGWWDVGVVIECPDGGPTCWILVLNTDGSTSVVAIPKAHLAAR
ncbi:MAG TPA: hypothetical protein K8W01_14720 [Methylorubrum populi]|uniref:Uncharacterized protein n=1 Tax=Methylorubrum populi TaxID=223967 RepID=A0A921JFN6_9HYPH|nr:hypothetical protein [Methylorubrum populi]